jgi:hypothetical protein
MLHMLAIAVLFLVVQPAFGHSSPNQWWSQLNSLPVDCMSSPLPRGAADADSLYYFCFVAFANMTVFRSVGDPITLGESWSAVSWSGSEHFSNPRCFWASQGQLFAFTIDSTANRLYFANSSNFGGARA